MAADGDDAVTALSVRSYDLILMDCQMPIMNGFEATRQIRRNAAAGPHIPIIAMTAKVTSGDREQCLTAGMDDYVTKPVKFSELTATIERWTSKLATPNLL